MRQLKLNKKQLNQLMKHNNKINKAVVLKLYPNNELLDSFMQFVGNERFVWNYFVSYSQMYHKLFPDAPALERYDFVKVLTALKRRHKWLKVNDSTGLQKTVEQFATSFDNMLHYYKDSKAGKHPRYVGFPKFHSRRKSTFGFGGKLVVAKWRRKNSSIWNVHPNIEVIDNHHIRLPKVGVQRVSKTTALLDCDIKEYRVIYRKDGHYELILFVESDNQAMQHSGLIGGVDCNLKNQCVVSNGKTFPAFVDNEIRKLIQKSIEYQRKMSRSYDRAKKLMAEDEHNKVLVPRTLEDFGNYWKYRRKFNHYNILIKRKKKLYFEQIANYLIDHFDVIVFENLNVQGMMKNHYVAKAIASAGWYQLREIVTYKCLWNNKLCMTVSPVYTTQTCHNCGFVNGKDNNQKITIDQREWKCPQCGIQQRRDQNAAINIMNKFVNNSSNYLHQMAVKQKINKPSAYRHNTTYLWKQVIESYSTVLPS